MKHLLLGLGVVLVCSCSSAKKGLKATVANLQEKNQAMLANNERNKANLERAFTEGGIDHQLGNAFKFSFESIEQAARRRDSVMAAVTKEGDFNKIKTTIEKITRQIRYDSVSVNIIRASIDVKSYYEFPSSALFGPGKFKIDEEKAQETTKIFRTALDSIVAFSNNYPGHPITIQMVTYGFADATAIREGSKLYESIAQELGNPTPLKDELNLGLSQLRAVEVAAFIQNLLNTSKRKEFYTPETIRIEAVGIGKGEELPNPKQSYTEDDPRRRIVKFYWKVLPIPSSLDELASDSKR